MSRRLVLSYRMFWVGLAVMLAAGILSATVWTSDARVMPLLTLIGASTALSGRLWHHRLRRALRAFHDPLDLGGYPLDLLRRASFTSGGRFA